MSDDRLEARPTDPAQSTHSMVVGLHRRFDSLEAHVDSLKQESRQMGERLIRIDGRVDVVEIKATAAEKREEIIFSHVREGQAQTNASIEKLSRAFEKHAETEDRTRRKIMFWLISTAASVFIAIGMVAFNRVFAG